MNTAAGVSTRNGAARRARASRSSARSVTITAGAVVAAIAVTTRPAARSPPRPSRTSPMKKSSAPGGMAGHVGDPVVLGAVGDPVHVGLEQHADVLGGARRLEVLVRVAEDPGDPLLAVHVGQGEQPEQPDGERRQQQRPPGEPLGQLLGVPPPQQGDGHGQHRGGRRPSASRSRAAAGTPGARRGARRCPSRRGGVRRSPQRRAGRAASRPSHGATRDAARGAVAMAPSIRTSPLRKGRAARRGGAAP